MLDYFPPRNFLHNRAQQAQGRLKLGWVSQPVDYGGLRPLSIRRPQAAALRLRVGVDSGSEEGQDPGCSMHRSSSPVEGHGAALARRERAEVGHTWSAVIEAA
jgi:hypothetical protein